ncbi:MAG: TldD/PmbA family protein [Candidatus Altiarchaeota archaeon]|nr:TldD/PmbA family protein [Candidatus Altiarchaeota archaeon]
MDSLKLTTRTTSIELRNGKLVNVSAGKDEETIFREYRGGWAVGNDMLSVKRAATLFPGGHLGPGERGRDWKPEFKIDPRTVELDDKLELINQVSSQLSLAGVKSIINYDDAVVSDDFLGDRNLRQEYSLVKMTVTAIASKSGKLQRNWRSYGGIGGFELLRKLEGINEIAEIAKELLSAKKAPAGQKTVILDPDFTGVLAHEAFGHAAEADHVVGKNSVLDGLIGERVASDQVSIIDDASLNAFGSYGFDRDGVQSQKTIIVEDGILKGLLHSRETAGKLGSVSTGNCRGRVGQVRMSNTFIDKGKHKLDEMIAETKHGLLLIGSAGGTTSPGLGVFNFNAKYGFIIKNGEKTNMVRDVSLLGQTLETLKQVDAVSDDQPILKMGICGKGGERARVSLGGPFVRTNALVG